MKAPQQRSGRSGFLHDLEEARIAERVLQAALVAPAVPAVDFHQFADGGEGQMLYRQFSTTLLLAFLPADMQARYVAATSDLSGRDLAAMLGQRLRADLDPADTVDPADFTASPALLEDDRSRGKQYDIRLDADLTLGAFNVGSTLEVKDDSASWKPTRRNPNGTGNAFIEVAQWPRGNGYPDRSQLVPSGVMATTADTFAISMSDWKNGNPAFVLLTRTDDLRAAIEDAREVQGGVSENCTHGNPSIGRLLRIGALLV